MKYLFTLILSCFLFFGLSAQDIFQKHVGSTGADYLTDMQRLSDGTFIALGYTYVKSADSSYAQLFKLDTAMNVLWSKSFSFNKQMKTTDITPTLDGGFLLAGRTWSVPSTTKQGGFVIKTDATGTATWNRIIKFDGSETMLKVMEEADKTLRYFVSGATTTHYIKAAADGTTTSTPIAPTNGAYDLVSKKVVRISAERYALIGKFENTADCIMMLNKDTIQWTQQYFGIINEGRIFNVATDAKGDLYFAGDYKVSAYDIRQTHVGKIATSNGAIQWRTVLPLVRNGGRGIDTTWRFTIGNNLQFSGRQVYVSGSMLNEQKSFSYACISAFDTASTSKVGGDNWKWTRQYGSKTGTSDSFARVFVLPNGQLLGAGHTGLGGNAANPNFYFVKTDTAGVSSCNFDSYSPVEQVSSSAYLNIYEALVGLAPAQLTMTTYTDAIPTTNRVPLGTTTTLCSATLCVGDPVTVTVTPSTICLNDSVTIKATGAAAYLWSSLALDATRTDSTFKIPINVAGTSVFSLSGTPRGQSCFLAKTVSVLVNPLPSASLSAARLMCSGDSLTISSGASSANMKEWSSASNSNWRAGTSTTGGNIICKPDAPGVHTYNVKVTDATTKCVNTNSTTITVRDNVTPTVTFDPIGCPGPNLTLRARGTNAGDSPFFDWLLDGQLIGGRSELELPNAIGKKIQVIMNVGADVCPLPPATRQVKSAIITVSCQGVSTKDLVDGLQNIIVYPNPTEGAFSVKMNLETSKTVSFRLLNMLGQTIQQVAPRSVSSGEMIQEFNVNNVPTGIYLVETLLDNKSVLTKLQIQ